MTKSFDFSGYRNKYEHRIEPFDNKSGKYKTLTDKNGDYATDQLHISAWNVNGIRAVLRKGVLQKYLEEFQPDILTFRYIQGFKNLVKFMLMRKDSNNR